MKDQSFYAFFALIALIPIYWASIAVFVREYNKQSPNDHRPSLKLWSANPKDTFDVVKALWTTRTGNQNRAAFSISAFFARILFAGLLVGFVAFLVLGL